MCWYDSGCALCVRVNSGGLHGEVVGADVDTYVPGVPVTVWRQ